MQTSRPQAAATTRRPPSSQCSAVAASASKQGGAAGGARLSLCGTWIPLLRSLLQAAAPQTGSEPNAAAAAVAPTAAPPTAAHQAPAGLAGSRPRGPARRPAGTGGNQTQPPCRCCWPWPALAVGGRWTRLDQEPDPIPPGPLARQAWQQRATEYRQALATPEHTSRCPSGWNARQVMAVRGSWPQQAMLLARAAPEGSDRSLQAGKGTEV